MCEHNRSLVGFGYFLLIQSFNIISYFYINLILNIFFLINQKTNIIKNDSHNVSRRNIIYRLILMDNNNGLNAKKSPTIEQIK
jgi:hypothetical protein